MGSRKSLPCKDCENRTFNWTTPNFILIIKCFDIKMIHRHLNLATDLLLQMVPKNSLF